MTSAGTSNGSNGDLEMSEEDGRPAEEMDFDLIQIEENKLKLENEIQLKKETRESDGESAAQAKENSEEREKEMKERRCQRLISLLKRSRMYAAELTNQIKTKGMDNMRKKRGSSNRQKSDGDKSRKAADPLRKNDSSQHSADAKAEGGEGVAAVMGEEVENGMDNTDVDYFERTRVTRLGFTVSAHQPALVEGGVMRDYQLKGFEWLETLFSNGVNGILADEMGIGKTLQVIALICSLIQSGITGPFLIIAPLSLIANWVAEFRKFAPRVPTLFFHGSKKDRKDLFAKIMDPIILGDKKVLRVVITSFEVTLFEAKPLSKIMWHYVIVDEGHRIKNHNSQLSRTLRSFNSVGKLLITGTPLQNDLSELWSLLNFIVPEVFTNLEVFQLWFDIQDLELDGTKFMEENYNINIITTLQQILMPFLLRREKKDVNLKLPPKKEVLVYCPMTPLQKKLYEGTVDRTIEKLLRPKNCDDDDDVDASEPLPKRACVLRGSLESGNSRKRYSKEYDRCGERSRRSRRRDDGDGDGDGSEFAWNLVMRNPQMQLRKIVNHPYLIQFPLVRGTEELKIDEDMIRSSGKLLVVDAILARLKSRGHKVVIFSTFKVLLDILEYLAEFRGHRFCRLDGNTKIEDRQERITQFNNNPDIFVFLVSMRAGGQGINLTGADTIIIYDSDWNPQINLQSQDRCHRIGQTKPVVIYKLCVRGTVDERILDRGNAKRRLEKAIIQKGMFAKGNHSSESCGRLDLKDLQELKELLSSTDHDTVIHSNGFVFTDEELDALLDRSDVDNDSEDGGQPDETNKKKKNNNNDDDKTRNGVVETAEAKGTKTAAKTAFFDS